MPEIARRRRQSVMTTWYEGATGERLVIHEAVERDAVGMSWRKKKLLKGGSDQSKSWSSNAKLFRRYASYPDCKPYARSSKTVQRP